MEHISGLEVVKHTELLSLLIYDPQTGVFVWRRKPARRIAVGAVAGTTMNAGGWKYIIIKLDHRRYLAHRLAWFYVTARWPDHEVDHRNGDGLDNRFYNLRTSTRAENAQNMRSHRDSASSFVGVCKCRKKWRAAICVAGVNRHLGVFSTPEEASLAYGKAKAEFHRFQPSVRSENA